MRTLAEIKRVIRSHQDHWPVMMVPLAKDLGINVYRVSGWPNRVSGRIFADPIGGGDEGYSIEVNAAHHQNRRRFTIAHEIAHYALHSDKIGFGDGVVDDALYRSGLSNQAEREANSFASQILMPDHLIQRARDEFGDDPIRLAREFQVSEESMRIRLGAPATSHFRQGRLF